MKSSQAIDTISTSKQILIKFDTGEFYEKLPAI
jgi:hypothetical protein